MSLSYKKRRRRNDHSVDDWLMTYADMITLLLCFFAIFLSVSVPKEEQFQKARERVMEHFSAPDQVRGKVMPRDDMSGNPQDELPYDSLPSIVDRHHSGEGRSVGFGIDIGEGQSEGAGEGALQGTGPRDGVRDDAYVRDFGRGESEEEEGDRIKTMEMPSAAFFASGSAELSEEGKKLLKEILDTQLNAPGFLDYQITIEGHTDDVPINTLQFPSNWELSTGRAAAVVRFFIEQGVQPQRLSASGYADIFPKTPNRDAAGNPMPGNQAQNRRVVIKLEKIEKKE